MTCLGVGLPLKRTHWKSCGSKEGYVTAQLRDYQISRPIWKASSDTFYTIDAVAHYNCQTNAMVIHHAQTASQFAAWGRILAAAAVFVMTVPRTVVAEETLAPHLMEWRSDSIAISGTAARAMILRQFTAFDPRYLEQKRRFAPQITAAAAEIRDHEERGRSLPCSTQMYLEAKWLLNSTAYF